VIVALDVDGYVWLDSNGTPGLGGRLWASLDQRVCVIGVAKTRFP
jgi:deoxyribonuclease V